MQPEDVLESLGMDLGYRFITDELAEDGIPAGRKRASFTSARSGRLFQPDRRLFDEPPDDRPAGRPLPKPSTTIYCHFNKPLLHPPVEPGQFRSHAFVRALREQELHGPMGRVGACADNAAMESLSALLQKNVLNRRRWQHATSSGWRS